MNNVVPFPNQSANPEQKNTRFVQTEDGISRMVKPGESPILTPITTDGLCPKIIQVINQLHANGEMEKIRMLQVGNQTFKIDSETWKKPVALARAIDLIKGQSGRIITKQEVYLSEALDALYEKEAEARKEYHRTGWHQGQFLIPNSPTLEKQETVISLLPYDTSGGEIEKARKALNLLLETAETQGPIILADLLLAPLLEALTLPRFGLFLSARAGTGKTEILKLLMCIYGSKWSGEELLSFAGTTENAAVKLAESARGLPFPIDNLRPQDGHILLFDRITDAIMEGKGKARLDRSIKSRDRATISCLPIATGEDFPEGDAGRLGRWLVIEFLPTKRLPISEWIELKKQVEQHFPAIGRTWLAYLEKNLASKEWIKSAETSYKEILNSWQKEAEKKGYRTIQNIERIIKNIASLELVFWLASDCPELHKITNKHYDHFGIGCTNLLDHMCSQNQEKSFGMRINERFQDAITARSIPLEEKAGCPISKDSRPGQNNMGWKTNDGTYYLIVSEFLKWIKKEFGEYSSIAIYRVLEQEGLIASHDKGFHTKTIWLTNGEKVRVIHLKLKE